MSILHINWRPSDRHLRQFGIAAAIALPLVGTLWSANSNVVAWLAMTGLVLALIGWWIPRALIPLYVVLTIVTLPFGMVIGEMVLILIFVLLFLPIGLLFKIVGRDRLQLRMDRQMKSYWRPKKQPKSMASYYHQS